MNPTTDAASLYSGFSPHQQTSQVFRLAGRGKVNLVSRTRNLTDKVHTENLFEGALNANKMRDVLWNALAVRLFHIMLQKLPIMLFSNAPKCCLLCY